MAQVENYVFYVSAERGVVSSSLKTGGADFIYSWNEVRAWELIRDPRGFEFAQDWRC